MTHIIGHNYGIERGENVKDPKDIKRGLDKCLSIALCNGNCPYADLGYEHCCGELNKDALEYIEQLEERIAIMTEGKEGE